MSNDIEYLTELLLYFKKNLTISLTGSCSLSTSRKVTLHCNKRDIFGNVIKLCIPVNKYIVEKSSNKNINENIRTKYEAGELVEFDNQNNIKKKINGQGQKGGLTDVAIIIIVIVVFLVFGAVLNMG